MDKDRGSKIRMVPSGSAGDAKCERHYEVHIVFPQRSIKTWGLLLLDNMSGQGPSLKVSVPDRSQSLYTALLLQVVL